MKSGHNGLFRQMPLQVISLSKYFTSRVSIAIFIYLCVRYNLDVHVFNWC